MYLTKTNGHKKKEPQFFGGRFNLTARDDYLSLMNDPNINSPANVDAAVSFTLNKIVKQ